MMRSARSTRWSDARAAYKSAQRLSFRRSHRTRATGAALAFPCPPPPRLRSLQPMKQQPEETLGVYVISVTARILHMHPQTLRKYERLGLVHPSRSVGMVRYYSDHDLNRLRMIKYLVEERGMNLAGVELALEMVSRLQGMQRALEEHHEAGAAAALDGHVQSVLEMLHYAERDLGAGTGQDHTQF